MIHWCYLNYLPIDFIIILSKSTCWFVACYLYNCLLLEVSVFQILNPYKNNQNNHDARNVKPNLNWKPDRHLFRYERTSMAKLLIRFRLCRGSFSK